MVDSPTGRIDLPEHLLSEEDKFEKLSPSERLQAIEKHNLDKIWWGFCAKCKYKIVAMLKDWPRSCPECDYASTS